MISSVEYSHIYDGDQITCKVPWSVEANNEAEELMYQVSNFVSLNGKFMRSCANETAQTIYTLTRDPK